MYVREKLVELQLQADIADNVSENTTQHREFTADFMMANGVTVQEWISVKDKLPQECSHPYDDMTRAVLIYTPVDGYTHIGWYAGKDYRGRDVWKTLSAMRSWQTCTKKVTHWQYLPQPPKGE